MSFEDVVESSIATKSKVNTPMMSRDTSKKEIDAKMKSD